MALLAALKHTPRHFPPSPSPLRTLKISPTPPPSLPLRCPAVRCCEQPRQTGGSAAKKPSNKLVTPPTIGDRLQNATTTALNVVALPAGLTFLALALPAVWAYRLFTQLTKEPMDMAGKVVLVTGASSGIGEHIAYEYARFGARLGLVARRGEKLQEVADEARRMGSPEAVAIVSDLGNEEGCKKAVEAAIERFGGIDVLVCNAGVFQSYLFEHAEDTEGFQSIMDVNFWSYVYTTHYALPHLKTRRGQIVVNSSVSSIVPQPRNTLYNASKSAVTNFYHTLRIELGDSVHVTMFSPGITKSEITDGKFAQSDGKLPDYEEARKLRNEQFGLYPTIPTPRLAQAAVEAARYQKHDITIPFWFSVFQGYRLLAPELLDNLLRFMIVRDVTVNKQVLDTLKIEKGQPSRRDYEEGALTAPGERRRRS